MVKKTRPVINVSWAENGARVAPDDTKLAEGWVEEIPPSQWENYWHWRVDESIRYMLQNPITEWSANEDYYAPTSFVLGSDGIIYQALQTSGVSTNNPTNPTGGANDSFWRNTLVYAVNNNNAASATKLQTARKIAGQLFDGTKDIEISASDVGALPTQGNAASATKLQTARKIGGVDFDGTKDIRPDANYIDFAAIINEVGVNDNIKSISGLTTPLSVSQGGTGSSTISGAKVNLQLDKFQQQTNDSRIYRLDNRGYLVITSSGTVGYFDISTSTMQWSFDSTGVMQTGTVPIARVEGLEPFLADSIPVGVPIPYPLETPPDGWIIMMGQTFLASVYPALALVYPSLRLPDMRGNFIRGWDGQRGYDPSRTILSQQLDAMQPITATVNAITGGWTTATGAFAVGGAAYNNNVAASVGVGGYGVNFDSSRQTRTADETRPKNIAFNYIVRAR